MEAEDFFAGLLGTTLRDRFVLSSIIGRGGYGAVFCSEDSILDRTVAIKVLRPDLEERNSPGRFFREAKILAKINHPNVINIIDFGQQEGVQFLVMEFVEGQPLAQINETQFPLPATRIAEVCDQVLAGLEETHATGIIHRDLKPENLLITKQRDGTDLVKVVDFGTAMFTEPNDGFKTQEGLLIGTPAYMSPEQCKDLEIDGRSDLYALGCILYEMLCGAPPFTALSSFDIMVSHLYHDALPPSTRVKATQVSPGLEMLAMWCLAKLPEERPSSASQVRRELARVRQQGLFAPVPPKGSSGTSRLDPGHRSIGLKPRDAANANTGSSRILVIRRDQQHVAPVIEALRARGDDVIVREDLPSELELKRFAVVVIAEQEMQKTGWLEKVATSDIPALICGPDDDLDGMARALEQGAYDFIPIPINPMALNRSISRAARARRRKHGK